MAIDKNDYLDVTYDYIHGRRDCFIQLIVFSWRLGGVGKKRFKIGVRPGKDANLDLRTTASGTKVSNYHLWIYRIPLM